MARAFSSAAERVTAGDVFLGWVEPYHKPRTRGRGPSSRAVWFARRPDGVRTEFTLPSRRQAIDWLKGAR